MKTTDPAAAILYRKCLEAETKERARLSSAKEHLSDVEYALSIAVTEREKAYLTLIPTILPD